MTLNNESLILIIFAFGFSHIHFDRKKNYSLIYFFKPATMITIILLAFNQPIEISTSFKILILIGLLFSLFGDILLMLKNRKFTFGLLAFLVGHIFYILALQLNNLFFFNIPLLIICGIFLITLLKFLLPKSENKKYYLIIYGIVITFLLWQGLARMLYEGSVSAIFFGIGVLLFTISDSILALNKFHANVKNAQIKILSTYYIAQTLIALSI